MFFRIFKKKKEKKEKYSYDFFVNHYGKEKGEKLYNNRNKWNKTFVNEKN